MAHEHKYFLFETKATFEPYTFTLQVNEADVISKADHMAQSRLIEELPELYERIEYAIMACNCGDAIKRRIKDGEQSAAQTQA